MDDCLYCVLQNFLQNQEVISYKISVQVTASMEKDILSRILKTGFLHELCADEFLKSGNKHTTWIYINLYHKYPPFLDCGHQSTMIMEY